VELFQRELIHFLCCIVLEFFHSVRYGGPYGVRVEGICFRDGCDGRVQPGEIYCSDCEQVNNSGALDWLASLIMPKRVPEEGSIRDWMKARRCRERRKAVLSGS
jgi:hypothetical protein